MHRDIFKPLRRKPLRRCIVISRAKDGWEPFVTTGESGTFAIYQILREAILGRELDLPENIDAAFRLNEYLNAMTLLAAWLERIGFPVWNKSAIEFADCLKAGIAKKSNENQSSEPQERDNKVDTRLTQILLDDDNSVGWKYETFARKARCNVKTICKSRTPKFIRAIRAAREAKRAKSHFPSKK